MPYESLRTSSACIFFLYSSKCYGYAYTSRWMYTTYCRSESTATGLSACRVAFTTCRCYKVAKRLRRSATVGAADYPAEQVGAKGAHLLQVGPNGV